MIIIPMAGMSSRFFLAGYTKPKYMLEAHGMSLFEHSVSSFKAYFKNTKFLFIIRDEYDTEEFVRQKLNKLGVNDFELFKLKSPTRGQAETVALGLESTCYKGPITIFNIDTFRADFKYPDLTKLDDGYLEVFKGQGDNWSFVKPLNAESTVIVRSTEKDPISDFCCTGLYHFKDKELFMKAYKNYVSLPKTDWVNGELYIAPMYNYLINKNYTIHYNLIENKDVVFCGVPKEYIDFKNQGFPV
jgi:hypothetical protein